MGSEENKSVQDTSALYYVKHVGIDGDKPLYAVIAHHNQRNVPVRDFKRSIDGGYVDFTRGVFLKTVDGLTEEEYDNFLEHNNKLEEAIKNNFASCSSVTTVTTLRAYVETDDTVNLEDVSVEEYDLPF